MSSCVPPSDQLKAVVDHTVKIEISKEIQNLDPKERGKERGRVMSDMCSRIIQKLNAVLKEQGLAGDDEFPGGYQRGKVYEKIKIAFQKLDAIPSSISTSR